MSYWMPLCERFIRTRPCCSRITSAGWPRTSQKEEDLPGSGVSLVLPVSIATSSPLPNFLPNVKLQAYLSPPYHLSLKMFVLLWGWCGISNEKVAGLHLQWEDAVLMFKQFLIIPGDLDPWTQLWNAASPPALRTGVRRGEARTHPSRAFFRDALSLSLSPFPLLKQSLTLRKNK